MRILHLSWEYPPLLYGGLGRHVTDLTAAQAAAGHDVVVVTQTDGERITETVQVPDGEITVVRTPRPDPDLPFNGATMLDWVAGFESVLTTAITELAADFSPDVIHAHDWMVLHVAQAAQQTFGRPLVATIHATEAGRHQGWLPNDLSRELHRRDWTLANVAQRVITCSDYMKSEARELFAVPARDVDVVPNGIDLNLWRTTDQARRAAHKKYSGKGPLLVNTGRLEWEKGTHTLLEAVAVLQDQFPDIRLVIAGRGSRKEWLIERAAELQIDDHVDFLGWLPEDELHALIAAADAYVVPSLYEPFGLVALEAVALGAKVVVAESGGLAQFADSDEVAVGFTPGNPASAAQSIERTLTEPDTPPVQGQQARELLHERYSWARVEGLTADVYRRAQQEWQAHGISRVTAPEPPRDTQLLASLGDG